jgi:hypothetical protein
VINCYHRFRRGDMRRVLFIELARDYCDDPAAWQTLARNNPEILEAAINKLKSLRVPKQIR